MYWHKYSLTELDNLWPWEKKIYTEMIAREIEKAEKANNDSQIQRTR